MAGMNKSVAAADPDLQIGGRAGRRGWRGQSSKPRVKGPQLGLKIRGGVGSRGTSPGSATE